MAHFRYPPVLLLLYLLAVCALVWYCRFDPFFWDTVQLGSKHAHFFYENGLKWAPLPPNIDSGHPPSFGYYLAVCWTLFGKTLPVSHAAMLPFLWANVWLFWQIGRKIAGEQWAPWFPLLSFCDPVLLGQSVMISPDVCVVTGFLLALYGILVSHRLVVLLGVILLCVVSMRGMMTAAALGLFQLILCWQKRASFQTWWQTAVAYVPGFLLAGTFLWWHQQSTGWIGYHPDSPWAAAFRTAPPVGMLRNVAIVGWRWLDFGRFAAFILLGILVWRSHQQKLPYWRNELVVLWICLLLLLTPSALVYQNLSAHRYFLPAFLGLNVLVFQWMTQSNWPLMVKKRLLALWCVCLLTGNLWIYPRGISMDWDSTLAHWPYHGLRAEAMTFLDGSGIDLEAVGTTFPNKNAGENLMLNGDRRVFTEKDFDKNQWMMTSNVLNDFSEAEHEQLERYWQLKWARSKRGVWIKIYARNPESGN